MVCRGLGVTWSSAAISQMRKRAQRGKGTFLESYSSSEAEVGLPKSPGREAGHLLSHPWSGLKCLAASYCPGLASVPQFPTLAGEDGPNLDLGSGFGLEVCGDIPAAGGS